MFSFDESYYLGVVREVDTRKVSILVEDSNNLKKARVNQLIAAKLNIAYDYWLIGMIDKVIKSIVVSPTSITEEEEELEYLEETVVNTVKVTFMGALKWDASKQKNIFTRSVDHVPEIDTQCFVLKDANLEVFMGHLSDEKDSKSLLELGVFKLDDKAKALLDGNKLFQRHAAILGSTGSGKSWTVATLLENTSKLPSSNIIVYDLHSEYKSLAYAKQLRIPGPEDDISSPENIYLPYWLLNNDEIQTLFVDGSEFTAHNQVVLVQNTILELKKKFLEDNNKADLIETLTFDSPIPYRIEDLLERLEYLNTERVPGANNKDRNGPYHGELTRLLVRIKSRVNDKRYSFLFQNDSSYLQYESLYNIVAKLMSFAESNIKVVDFSDVPADILPTIIGLVSRLTYQVQFWTDSASRRPLAFVCDEAHLYLPNYPNSPLEKRAVATFEKIAKEGRKYGVALLIVSQRPSDVSTTILSQCNNIISLRLTNSDDQSAVRSVLPESYASLLEQLPLLDVGEAMVVGDAVLLPSRIKIYEPTQKPLSATIDFWTKWSEEVKETNFEKSIENMRRQNRN